MVALLGGNIMKTPTRTLLSVVLMAGAASALMSVASAQNDPAQRVDVVREAPAESGLSGVTLPREVVEAASAYEAYLHRASAIGASFHGPETVGAALKASEAYQPQQMEEGMIAYAALIALEDQRFVRSVRDSTSDDEIRSEEAEALLAHPDRVAAFPGSGNAAALISSILREEGGTLFQTGRAVKQSAYGVQHEAWSKQTAPNAAGRLAQAKSLSSIAYTPAPGDVSDLLQSAAAFRGRPANGELGGDQFTPVVQRGLALAALAVLGRAGTEAQVAPLLSERDGADCMKMAKLNLYQCLAVAGPHYEDIFCLGQHALMDTGQCVVSSAAPASSLMERSVVQTAQGGVDVPVNEASR
jgi:hypothetical protein